MEPSLNVSYARLHPSGAGAAVDNVTNDAAALAQALGDDVATFVDDAPWYANQTLRDADALKNETLWTAADVVFDVYNQGMRYWPGKVEINGVGGAGVGPPMDPESRVHALSAPPTDEVDPPKAPPAKDAIEDTVESVAGPGSADAGSGEEAPIGATEPEATNQTSREAEPSKAEPGRAQRDAPPSEREPYRPDGEEPPLAPANLREDPSRVAGLGFAAAATTLATFAFGAWLLSRTGIVGRIIAGSPFARLFSRQAGQDVLKHPLRARIYVAISQHPGITAKLLSEVTRIRASSLRYHLGVLQREEQVHAARDGKILHYHPAGADPRAKATQCLFLKHRGLLAKTILGKPGASQQRLAREMGLPASVVCTYVHDLTRAGLVHSERAGRFLRYFPTDLLEGIQEQGRIPDA